jgi:hypothetical protein
VSPYSKRWWSKDLADEKRKTQQLGGRAKHHQENMQHLIHNEYPTQQNHYMEGESRALGGMAGRSG